MWEAKPPITEKTSPKIMMNFERHSFGCGQLSQAFFRCSGCCYSCQVYSSCVPKQRSYTSDWGKSYFSLHSYWKIATVILPVGFPQKHSKLLADCSSLRGCIATQWFLSLLPPLKFKGSGRSQERLYIPVGGTGGHLCRVDCYAFELLDFGCFSCYWW